MHNILFQPSPKVPKTKKRKATNTTDANAKKSCIKRIFSNFPEEKPEPEEFTQVCLPYFMKLSNNF